MSCLQNVQGQKPGDETSLSKSPTKLPGFKCQWGDTSRSKMSGGNVLGQKLGGETSRYTMSGGETSRSKMSGV